ncbi:hypothetical protein [Winogradskyella immobilis]|uniref:Uncharacterized protein n=1 Tax=Winogradskyella immobilis TaxID=2816852 RepID=A0ABS8EJK9_9FLAO|nr:hypothetical protein [Winogradskyella immobilis]MCC1483374.1 hypothetical protein [Winogradskyella immobilis]MCG0015468.1 hypothetical protein [Winogradskyella immobilis]
MKRLLLLLMLLMIYNYSFSQEYQSSLNKSNITLTSGAIPDDVIIKVSQNENGFTNIVIESFGNSNKIVKFSLKPFNYSLFEAKLKNSFLTLLQKKMIPSNYNYTINQRDKIKGLFNEIASYLFTVNERPQVATINLKSEEIDVYASIKHSNGENNKGFLGIGKKSVKNFDTVIGELENPVVEISFYSGFIEKIEVRGKLDGIDITFVNKYSIGVSSISNLRGFRLMKLYSLYDYSIKANPTQTHDTQVFPNGENFIVKREDKSSKVDPNYIPISTEKVKPFMFVNDIIDYQRIIDVNANDISPSKQKILLDLNQKSSNLYKEESTKILEAVVYSDLIGALEEDNPNGIIQTEISKRFNINTARGDFLGGGGGFFEYLDGKVLLSKIEENNKFLLPENGGFDNLSLYQYRNFSVGGNLNLLAFENQNLKLNGFIDSGIEFARSGYRFTEDEEGKNTNSFEWASQLRLHFFPEKRYGIFVSDKLSFNEILTDDIEFRSVLNEKSNWINTIEFMAYLDISTSSKVFVRYSISNDLMDIDNNFSRFQLGTAFYFLQKNRKDK